MGYDGENYSAPSAEPLDHFIRVDGKEYAGRHLIIDLYGAKNLDDEALIERAFRACIDACGATLLHIHLHKFTPNGVSGVAVLSESHISIHTWPERGYAALDVFMCGKAMPELSVPILKQAFEAADVKVNDILRGEDA